MLEYISKSEKIDILLWALEKINDALHDEEYVKENGEKQLFFNFFSTTSFQVMLGMQPFNDVYDITEIEREYFESVDKLRDYFIQMINIDLEKEKGQFEDIIDFL